MLARSFAIRCSTGGEQNKQINNNNRDKQTSKQTNKHTNTNTNANTNANANANNNIWPAAETRVEQL